MNERWRTIQETQNLYLISDRGRVFSVRRGIFLAPSFSGYVMMHVKGKTISRKISSLVQDAFPLACDCGECTSSVDCWHCGFNPDVCRERRETFKKRGLEKTENGTWAYRITEADRRKGITRLTPRVEK